MRYFNLLTSITFIVYGILGIADAGVPSAAVKKLESEMPIYTAIYNYDKTIENDMTDFIDKLDKIFAVPKNQNINAYPNKRSALHRAIEHMEPDLVQWLIDKTAKADYGADSSGNVNVIKKAGEPAHLLGHLEQYYNTNKEAKAIEIIDYLFSKLGCDYIENWPAKTEKFKKLREKWNDDKGHKCNKDNFKVDESSSASLLDDSKSSNP